MAGGTKPAINAVVINAVVMSFIANPFLFGFVVNESRRRRVPTSRPVCFQEQTCLSGKLALARYCCGDNPDARTSAVSP